MYLEFKKYIEFVEFAKWLRYNNKAMYAKLDLSEIDKRDFIHRQIMQAQAKQNYIKDFFKRYKNLKMFLKKNPTKTSINWENMVDLRNQMQNMNKFINGQSVIVCRLSCKDEKFLLNCCNLPLVMSQFKAAGKYKNWWQKIYTKIYNYRDYFWSSIFMDKNIIHY